MKNVEMTVDGDILTIKVDLRPACELLTFLQMILPDTWLSANLDVRLMA